MARDRCITQSTRDYLARDRRAHARGATDRTMTTAMGSVAVASARAVGFASHGRGGARAHAVGRCLVKRWTPARVHVSRTATTATRAARENGAVDAIVVVAGGIEEDGTLPSWVTPRLDYAARAYADAADDAKPRILLSGSMTPHKPPPMAKGGFNLHESTSMAGYLMEKGIPANSLLKDTASMDTIGNAYYSLCLHAIPRGWTRVEVVTSAFHMARTRAAFEWVWGLSPLGSFDMRFVSTEDAGIDPSGLRARAEREAQSVAALKDNASRVTTLTDFNEWLFTTHKCYAVSRQHEIGVFDELSEETRKSMMY